VNQLDNTAGEIMNKQYGTVLLTLICVVGLTLGARAQEREDSVIAKVPYDFVVAGVVLPEGTYRVSRIDTDRGSRELEISNYEGSVNLLLLPAVFDDFETGHPQLSFQHVGDKYFLSSIQTPIGTYALSMHVPAISVAQEKPGASTTSGTN
jgi:hypothetical protein